MPPPDKTDEPAPDKEPAPPQGDAPGAPDPEPQKLGILFLAAAIALALLLTIIGLLAAAAMSRMPFDPEEPRAALVTPERPFERATPPSV